MDESHKCPECDTELASDVSDGHCPACLLQLGLAQPDEAETTALHLGDRIGRYRLIEKLGEGGCGVVFCAEQEEPVRRQVAFKVIKLGMDTHRVIARFEAERQTLAVLDHPHIAKVFDADATEAGRPFFVMELVRGTKITRYCDEHSLSIRERLELFVLVCLAVQHAHQKGIIHRDLKPSNILVVEGEHGAKATPKIIDFGIAKTMEQPSAEQTAVQQFVGTPAYMSPEQAGREGADVDTRSDIYSLGVLLYELLAGVAPFDAAELRRYPAHEVARFIREKEPPKPSTRLASLAWPQLAEVSQRRKIETAALPRSMRGELDWIVMKCLEKDREQRYETAFGLARDLQRYLADEPITARPPSQWYRFEKLVQRNRIAFGATMVVTAALMVGATFTLLSCANEKKSKQRLAKAEAKQRQFSERIEAARQIVMRQSGKSFEVAKAWEEIIVKSAAAANGRDAEMFRHLLDRAATNLNHGLDDQPEIKAEILSTFAESYHQLGVYESMEKLDRAALQITQQFSYENLLTAKILAELGEALFRQNKLAEAEAIEREALALGRKLLPPNNPRLAVMLSGLDEILVAQGKLEEAATLNREAETIRQLNVPKALPVVVTSVENVSFKPNK